MPASISTSSMSARSSANGALPGMRLSTRISPTRVLSFMLTGRLSAAPVRSSATAWRAPSADEGLREMIHVVPLRVGHEVQVTRCPDDAVGAHCEPADDDVAHARPVERPHDPLGLKGIVSAHCGGRRGRIAARHGSPR